MRRVVVLGAGHSSPYLVERLLSRAAELEAEVVVADRDGELAASRIAGHPRGRAAAVDLDDPLARLELVSGAAVVVDFLPPKFLPLVAAQCIEVGTPLVSVSYLDTRSRGLDGAARERGVLVLAELGLDPGIDLMSAVELIDEATTAGGRVTGFESYGAGLPDDPRVNPLGYCITWNPRNVVMAASSGVQYLRDGRVRIVPWRRVFADTWTVEVDGLGTFDAYANRDSLQYREALGLPDAETLIRATLRYPGWAELWRAVVELGLPNEGLVITGLDMMTWAELLDAFLPDGDSGDDAGVEARCRRALGEAPGSPLIDRLRWLGLFSDRPVRPGSRTLTEALAGLLSERLPLPKGSRDMVVLHHRLTVAFPDRRERWESTLVERGEPGGHSAMARTVGLPAALGAELVLSGELDLVGCRRPVDVAVWRPLMGELRAAGITFRKHRQRLASPDHPRRFRRPDWRSPPLPR